MKIATIVPTAHLDLTRHETYHLALAQIAMRDKAYRRWFRQAAWRHGSFVMVDNGAAELGAGVQTRVLKRAAHLIDAHEVVLPDVVSNGSATRVASREGRRVWGSSDRRRMAVPHGATLEEYRNVAMEFLSWPDVQTIGISRFVVDHGLVPNRIELLHLMPEIVNSNRAIHLLGCSGDPGEAYYIERAFPNRVRGIDSGIAAIYTQAGRSIRDGPKPQIELDFGGTLDAELLALNIRDWRIRVASGVWYY